MHVNLSTMSGAELEDWRKHAGERDILRQKIERRLSRHTEWEFAVPFRLVDSFAKYVGKVGVPM